MVETAATYYKIFLFEDIKVRNEKQIQFYSREISQTEMLIAKRRVTKKILTAEQQSRLFQFPKFIFKWFSRPLSQIIFCLFVCLFISKV